MSLPVLLLIGIQLLCSWALSPPVVEPPPSFLPHACNDSDVEAAADLALRQINTNQKEGYVLGLYRIFSVQEQPQKITGSIFYLILDVVETECHVFSRKMWKDCNKRPEHETVFGQCKASLYINKPRRIVHLRNYECTLQPVPSSSFLRLCPDCPIRGCPTEPKYLEAAVVSLAKFNKESEQTHYFSVLNVTKASMQWVVGPSHFVEFTVQETSCSKNESIADVSKCKPLSPELAHIGVCKGSVVKSQIDHQQFVSISCQIYDPQAPATGDQEHHPGRKSEKHGKEDDESHEHHHHHGRKRKQHHSKHSDKHKHNHEHELHEEHDREHQHPSPSEVSHDSLHLEKTVGWVKILPVTEQHDSLHTLPESQIEQVDGKPIPPEKAKPGAASPHADGVADVKKPPKDRPEGKPGLTKPATTPIIPPFPEVPLKSDRCPGEPKFVNSIIIPLLPTKIIKILPLSVSP